MMASEVDFSFMMISFGDVLCPDLLQPDTHRIEISITRAIGEWGRFRHNHGSRREAHPPQVGLIRLGRP